MYGRLELFARGRNMKVNGGEFQPCRISGRYLNVETSAGPLFFRSFLAFSPRSLFESSDSSRFTTPCLMYLTPKSSLNFALLSH